MNVQIRPAKPTDLSALTLLARQTYVDAYGQDMTAEALARQLAGPLSPGQVAHMFERDVFLLAEHEGRLVGFVQFGVTRPEYRSDDGTVHAAVGDMELRRLYVLARQQGRGLGGRLMLAALHHSRLAGRRVFLTVWHTNVAAQRFYARHHFRQIGVFPLPVVAGGFDLLLFRDIRQP